MFTPDDILALAKAGFTAQQIAGLSAVQKTPAPAEPAPVPAESAPAPAEPAPAPAEQAPAPAEPAKVDPVLLELQKLTGLMQNSNIMNTTQPKAETPEEILAAIINPPMKKE